MLKDVILVHAEDYSKEAANELYQQIGVPVVIMPRLCKGIQSMTIEEIEDLLKKYKDLLGMKNE